MREAVFAVSVALLPDLTIEATASWHCGSGEKPEGGESRPESGVD
jgi:hypothetical protein